MDVSDEELEKASDTSFSELPRIVQIALTIFNTMPDIIEGMNGIWLGKNWSGVMDFMEIYEVDEKLECLEYLQTLNSYMLKFHGEKAKQRK